MHHRPLTGALALAGILGLSLSSGAMAAGFGTPIVDRAEVEGASSGLTDLDGFGQQIGLTFERSSESSGAEVGELYRPSDAEPFQGPGLTTGDHGRVTVCAGGPIAVLDADAGGHRAVLLANSTTFHTVSEVGKDFSMPDVACLDDDHFVLSMLVTADSQTHALLFLVDPATLDVDNPVDLGPARPGMRAAVAATRDRFHVAWVARHLLFLKSFTVTRSPFDVTVLPEQKLDTGRLLASPQLAAAGKRVLVAWERKYSVVARVSTDRGATFKPRKTLLAASPATAGLAVVTNAGALGGTLLVSATSVSEGITATGRILRSTNAGGTWRTVKGSVRRGGYVFGAFRGTARKPRVILAWDQQIASPTKGRIRVALAK